MNLSDLITVHSMFQLLYAIAEPNQMKYLFLLQVYFGPIDSALYLHVKNLQ